MPINPNIILGIKPMQFQMADPLESASKSLALQGLMGQRDMQEMQMRQAQQAEADDMATRDAFRAGGDQKAIIDRLMGAGQYKPAQALQKNMLETREKEGAINKTRAETMGKLLGFQKESAGALMANPTPENALAAVDQFERMATSFGMPELGQQAAQQRAAIQAAGGDPNAIRRIAAGWSLAAKDLLPQYKEINDGKTTRFVDTNAISNPGAGTQTIAMLTTPGQDQGDLRAREMAAAARAQAAATRDQAAATREANAVTYDPERGVLVNRATGEARPAMLGGQPIGEKDKPLNDAQAKALLFSNRMRESDKIITELAGKGTNVSVPGSRSNVFGPAINAMSAESQQSLDQAKRDFINAVLRRESGAVIADSEFANAEKQYFPQIGESAKIIAQKAANRKNALDSITQEVPEKKRAPDLRLPNRPAQMVPGANRAGPVAQPSGVKFLGFE
jgi:hypothetical protein